jgi:hypothetical protein
LELGEEGVLEDVEEVEPWLEPGEEEGSKPCLEEGEELCLEPCE